MPWLEPDRLRILLHPLLTSARSGPPKAWFELGTIILDCPGEVERPVPPATEHTPRLCEIGLRSRSRFRHCGT